MVFGGGAHSIACWWAPTHWQNAPLGLPPLVGSHSVSFEQWFGSYRVFWEEIEKSCAKSKWQRVLCRSVERLWTRLGLLEPLLCCSWGDRAENEAVQSCCKWTHVPKTCVLSVLPARPASFRNFVQCGEQGGGNFQAAYIVMVSKMLPIEG